MIYLLPIGRDEARMPVGIDVGVRALGTKRECHVPPQIHETVHVQIIVSSLLLESKRDTIIRAAYRLPLER